jgi:hypothetical protein
MMSINIITNNTGGELCLFDQSGATIKCIPDGKSDGPVPITIQSVAAIGRTYTQKTGTFHNDSAYTATIENLEGEPGLTMGYKVVFAGEDLPDVTFTM